MRRRDALLLPAALAGLGRPVLAQQGAQQGAVESAAAARANAATVGVVAGGIDDTALRIAADLAAVLDEEDRLRILAFIGRGAGQNLADILTLRGIDIALVQTDVLEAARRERLFGGGMGLIQYIAKLYDAELHVVARRETGGLAGLAGRRVAVGGVGGGTATTARAVFAAHGIEIEATGDDPAEGLAKLRAGEVAAVAQVTGQPAPLLAGLGEGFHLLPVALAPGLVESYLPAVLGHGSYPGLVPKGGGVGTVAVGMVMAVYGWPAESDRYQRLGRFVEAFFSRFEALRQAPRHGKWQEVNLAAQLPGWTRFAPAQAWLSRQKPQAR